MKTRKIGVLAMCATVAWVAQAGTLLELAKPTDWNAFAARGGHQCKVRVANEGLEVVCNGADGQLYTPNFTLKADASQEVVFRAKASCGGFGELFWMQPGKGPTQKLSTSFNWIGDGEWHEYRIRPFWQGEKTIGGFRIDFPTSAIADGRFTFSRIAVEETPLKQDAIDTKRYVGVAFTAASDKPSVGVMRWTTDESSGLRKKEFRLPGDGKSHRYFLELWGNRAYKGKVVHWEFDPIEGGAKPADVAWVEEAPDIPADLLLKSASVADAIIREGQDVTVSLLVSNIGTLDAQGVAITADDLPDGARMVNADALPKSVEGGGVEAITPIVAGLSEGEHTLKFTLKADGISPIVAKVAVRVLPMLNLPKADYVPEPIPAETDYDIGALYFPGWPKIDRWERVWKVCPERKPVLGWYDEANPEVIDWQIKWLVENGIRTLYVDWYWSKGSQHLDHWVKSFYKARYRRHLKWAMMWANHNAPGSHSVEDQKAVTKFWIDNYFKTPEYRQIDGKPVVWIWSPQNMERDVKDGGCKELLEISREMAKAAGFKGIYFIAMKWPEADVSANVAMQYKNMGFDMTGIYHFMSHGGRSENNRRFAYSQVADANTANWWGQQAAGVLPFMPNLSTGWDDRPWNDHCEIYGKNAADFRRICESAREFSKLTGQKRFCLAPLNEWGEGSYAEPNAEHGFGFYEAVRDTFCKRPAGGWRANVTPRDVGLGPYDLPMPKKESPRSSWDFTKGTVGSWNVIMGLSKPRATGDGLSYTCTTRDPALLLTFPTVRAKDWNKIVVRFKTANAKGALQLFWARSQENMREGASISLPIVADGEWHDYVFPVASNRVWRGRIGAFRIDPGCQKDAEVSFASVRLDK